MFTHRDVKDVVEFMSHPSVARIVTGMEPREASVREYIDKQNAYEPFEQDKVFDLAIERREDGKVIGLVTLIRRRHKRAELGYALGVEWRGQGYATEASGALLTYGFTVLGLHRIQAKTSNANHASWKVMERLGMRQEACLRDGEFRDGEWADTLIYGILDSEWRASQRPEAANSSQPALRTQNRSPWANRGSGSPFAPPK
jgi:RimJ/RimL family protein N-acetyltransferase